MDTTQQVYDIIASTLNIDPALITPELSVGDIDEWDSMGNVALLTALEEQLRVDFPIEELFELTSVEAIVNKVNQLIND